MTTYTQRFIALITSFMTLCVIVISNETTDGQHILQGNSADLNLVE